MDFLNNKNIEVEDELFLGIYTLKLLSELGFRPVLDQCVECGCSVSADNIKFDLVKNHPI